MVCKSCNKEILDNARFCTFCGALQDDPVVEPEIICEAEPVEEMPAEVEAAVETEVIDQIETQELIDPEAFDQLEEIPEAEETEVLEEPEVVIQTEVPAEPAPKAAPQRPAIKLPTDRCLAAMVFLSFLTFGIYPLVVWCKISGEINMVASRYDGKRTVHYLSALLLTLPTCFIFPFVWGHGLCSRIGKELKRRQINYRFGASAMWLWHILYVVCVLILAAIVFVILFTLGVVSKLVYILTAVACLLVMLVGPFVFVHKIMKAMNLMNAHYNHHG